MYQFSNKAKDLKPSAIREIFKSLSDPDMISLAAGNPSSESFPVADMARISADIYREIPAEALQYSVTEGYPVLRQQIAERLSKKFGIGTPEDEVIITTGGQQGIDLTAKALCNEGDVIVCESPSFIGALNAFRAYNTKLVGVDMDEDGINIEKLEAVLKTTDRVRLLYVIPTFQNPSGLTMSYEKRKRLLELSEQYGFVILEDNPYGELRFSGEDIPTIKSMDKNGRVVYCSSFSKILSAGMRIGFVCANAELTQKIVVLKQVNDVHTNIYFQLLCSRYIKECDLDGHIATIRKLYRHKSALMISALEENFDERVSFTRPEGGLFIWVTMPEGYDGDAFAKLASQNLVCVVPGSTFLCDLSERSASFRLNYSTPGDGQIITGVERLGKVMKEFLK